MFKVKYAKEMHIMKIEHTLAGLEGVVRKVFKSLPYQFHFTYRDQDNDDITIDCQDDLAVLLLEADTASGEKKGKMLKLQVKQDVQLLQEKEDIECLQDFISLQSQDDRESVELLSENDFITPKTELNHDGNESVDILSSHICLQESQIEIQKAQISNIVHQHLLKMEGKLIDKVLQLQNPQNQAAEISNYLQNLYQVVENSIVNESKIQQSSINLEEIEQDSQIGQLVEASLKKLLPNFMKRVSQEAIRSVKQLMRQQCEIRQKNSQRRISDF